MCLRSANDATAYRVIWVNSVLCHYGYLIIFVNWDVNVSALLL
jgi:hypothetical protein